MKKILLSMLVYSSFCFQSNAQNVNIPDANFKAYLVGEIAINTNQDTEIQLSEAQAYTDYIDASNLGISDFTGLEEFTAVTGFGCVGNSLTSIDISKNVALTSFSCNGNSITSLNLSANTALTMVICSSNLLTSLDVSANTSLEYLYCQINEITSLNLAANASLIEVWCNNNQLSSLDISNNTAITGLDANNNNLTCIQVADVTSATTNITSTLDAGVTFSLNCGTAPTTPTGIEEIVVDNFFVYPNPAQNWLSLSSNAKIELINIINVNGVLLNSVNGNSNSLDVSVLVPGIYFLEIFTESERFYRKFVKS